MTVELAYSAEDQADAARAAELLAAAEAAHRAEVEAERLRMEAIGREAAAEAQAQAFAINEARADAMNSVLRAICRRQGQQVIAFGPADAQAAHAFALALIELQSAPPVEVEQAYRQGAAPNAIAKGAAVELALMGDDDHDD